VYLNNLGYAVIIAVLLLVAFYFAWRQLQTLACLRNTGDLSPEDRRYVRNQAWRRLFCSGLMVLLAGLLIVSAVLGLEKRIAQVGREGEAARLQNETPVLTPEQKSDFQLYTAYWSCALLLVMAMLFTAAVDIWAIFRFGLRHHRQIQADRRAMVESEVARFRKDRNGHHGRTAGA
jgi:hypothetical protein